MVRTFHVFALRPRFYRLSRRQMAWFSPGFAFRLWLRYHKNSGSHSAVSSTSKGKSDATGILGGAVEWPRAAGGRL